MNINFKQLIEIANLALPTNPPTTKPSVKCGSGWRERPLSDYCYHFSDKVDTFERSISSCNQMGGNLVSITDVTEQFYLQNAIQYSLTSAKNYWIGANIESISEGWKWVDNSAFVFINWMAGGYNTGSNQFCAIITENGEWKTVECGNDLSVRKYNYVCKKFVQNQVMTTTFTSLPTKPGYDYSCPNGWSYFIKTNKCYKFFSLDNAKTYNDAKLACSLNNSRLVEINSEEENQFLISLLQSNKINQGIP